MSSHVSACYGLMSAGCCSYTDVWRRLHPEQEGVYTVWDEKTSARIFNEVKSPESQSQQRCRSAMADDRTMSS